MCTFRCDVMVDCDEIQDVLVQQAEEALHGYVVTRSADASHRPDHVVAAEGMEEFPAPKLAAAVAVKHAPGDSHRVERLH
jgi:hypothetical protein